MKTEFALATEGAAHHTRRAMITLGASVSLIAFDPARNVYAFDLIEIPHIEVYAPTAAAPAGSSAYFAAALAAGFHGRDDHYTFAYRAVPR